MSDRDQIEISIYDSSDQGFRAWLASQNWSEDDRKPYVRYDDGEASSTTGWVLTIPYVDDHLPEWEAVWLSQEPEGERIETRDDAVDAARQYLRHHPLVYLEPRGIPYVVDDPLEQPEEIESGDFAVHFDHDSGDGSMTPMEVHFTWEESSTATWWCDIWGDAPGLSPGSSAPADGWASWLNSKDVLIAFTWRDVGIDGWAHIEGGAPGSGDFDALFEKET